MACKIDKVKMIPASEDDAISPGSFYFACLNLQRKKDPESYWIVLRAPREWLPDGFFDTRPVQLRVFPFWIVGKDQRVWLPRSSLFNLDRSQREIFAERTKRHELANTLILIDSFKSVDAALAHYKGQILDSTKQYNERRERVDRTLARNRPSKSISPFPGHSAEIPVFGTKRGVENGPAEVETKSADRSLAHQNREFASQSKRRRFNTSTSNHSRSNISNEGQVVSRTKIHNKAQTSVSTDTMSEEPVRIFVGVTQFPFVLTDTVIKRGSALLHSWIRDDDHGKYIKHPDLDTVDPLLFRAIVEFMRDGDFSPRVVGIRAARDVHPFAGCTTADDYAKILVQSARIHNLSQVLVINGLDKHIYHRIKIRCDLSNDSAWIEFASVLWSRPFSGHLALQLARPLQPGQVTTPTTRAHYPYGANQLGYEFIDQYTVQQLAARFERITKDPVVVKKYFELVEETNNRHIHAAVLEEAANRYRGESLAG